MNNMMNNMMKNMMMSLAIVVLGLVVYVSASGVLLDAQQSFCYPTIRKQFGYSVAVTDNAVNHVIAVGAPWDNTVLIYQGTYQLGANNVSTLYWEQAGNVTANQIQYNGATFPTNSLLLFGFSVALTSDGSFLAVGAPGVGDTSLIPNGNSGTPTAIQDADYLGVFFLYKATAPASFELIGDFPIPNPVKIYDKFGHKVKFSTDNKWLFVTANAGWSGAPVDNEVFPGDAGWPAAPIVEVSNQGVYVYSFVSKAPYYNFTQFLKSSCAEPLGLKGTDLSIGNNNTLLLVRDCSPVDLLTSAVAVYNLINGTWTKQSYLSNPVITTHYYPAWFGYGLAVGQKGYVAIGEPSFATQVQIQQYWSQASNQVSNSSSVLLEVAGYLANVNVGTRSFYGGNVAFTAQDRLLFVSDAIKSNGEGIVYVYHLLNNTEYVSGFETTVASGVTGPYYLVGSFIKSLKVLANLTSSTYVADQFGAALASSSDTLVVGAPVAGCFYIYPVPQLIVTTAAVNIVPSVAAPNVTEAPSPPPIVPAGQVSNGANIALIAGLVAGIIAAILIAAAIFYALREYQKRLIRKRVLDKMSLLNTNQGAL